MKNIFLLILVSLIGQNIWAQKRVLVYTHNGKGYVHENIAASVKALSEICREQGYEFISTDNPAIFNKKDISTFDCLVFSNTNNETFDTEEQKAVFKEYINGGGGFVGIHSACGSERQWPWFHEVLGSKFVRHPKLQPFDIKVLDKSHPATAHLEDIWHWEDEFYYMNNLNPDIKVLLAGDLSTVIDEKKGEFPGEIFGRYFPLAWYHTFDGGRQFYTSLGHKSEYYDIPAFRAHLLGGIKWAMDEK